MSRPDSDPQSQYSGDLGRSYHASRHRADPRIRAVVSDSRMRKLQPYIAERDSVFEFGVGTGLCLSKIRCGSRVGYDVSDAGKAVCTEAGILFTTDRSTVPPGSFDVVICHHVLEHLADPFATLRFLHSLLKPEGKILLFVPHETNRFYRTAHADDPDMHLYSWNVNSLANLVRQAGFSIQHAHVTPFGYEQRLATLASFGMTTYRAALWLVRRLRPANEITVIGQRITLPNT